MARLAAALALLALLPATAAEASIPGRNGPILFRSDAGNVAHHESHAIWRVAPGGGGAVRLTRGAYPPGLEVDYSPVALPDGRRFAYIRQIAGNDFAVRNQVFVKSLSGPPGPLGTPLLPEAVDYKLVGLAASPDGDQLALAASPPPLAKPQLFLLDLDGSGMTQLTRGAAAASAPEFSPDGNAIAFTGRTEDSGGIYEVSVDGSGLRRLTSRRGDGAASFAPDGRHIAFNRHVGRYKHIFVMRADGTGPRQLTSGPFTDRGPAFSPNGRRIAFSRSGGGRNDDLYSVAATGSGLQLLYASRGALFSDFAPDWAPRPR
jgi:TolB protein